jgi:hypothetical protein
VADQVSTKLTTQDQKLLGATDDLTGWLKVMGIQPGGVVTPEAQQLMNNLFARKPGLFNTLKATGARKYKELSGDPDAQKFDQVISILKTEFARAQAGTLRVNAAELRLIMAAHPGVGDTAQTALDKLQRLSLYAERVHDRVVGGVPKPSNDTEPFPDLPPDMKPGAPYGVFLPGQAPGGGGSISPQEERLFAPQ